MLEDFCFKANIYVVHTVTDSIKYISFSSSSDQRLIWRTKWDLLY